MADTSNDNHSTVPAELPLPDAHGQAALMLVESLIHTLVERSAISLGDALDIVEGASDVIGEISVDLGDRPEAMQPSLTLLAAINKSLRCN